MVCWLSVLAKNPLIVYILRRLVVLVNDPWPLYIFKQDHLQQSRLLCYEPYIISLIVTDTGSRFNIIIQPFFVENPVSPKSSIAHKPH